LKKLERLPNPRGIAAARESAFSRLLRSGAAIAALLCAALPASAHAAAVGRFPSRPLRLIVPFVPGGPTDIVGRLIAQRLAESLGQSVIVDNRGGAGGNIGTDIMVRAAADGHTLALCFRSTLVTNPILMKDTPYDPLKDIALVTLALDIPYLLLVPSSSPAKSVSELIAAAKAKPGELAVGSAGVGSTSHLALELFASTAGVKLVHVPYKGSAPAVTDLMAGQLQAVFEAVAAALPHVRAGKVKALAIATLKRSALTPDIPTFTESGVPGYEMYTWHGVCAPGRTPRPTIDRLHREIVSALDSPEARARLAAIGAEPIGKGPEAFRQFVEQESVTWRRLLREMGTRNQ